MDIGFLAEQYGHTVQAGGLTEYVSGQFIAVVILGIGIVTLLLIDQLHLPVTGEYVQIIDRWTRPSSRVVKELSGIGNIFNQNDSAATPNVWYAQVVIGSKTRTITIEGLPYDSAWRSKELFVLYRQGRLTRAIYSLEIADPAPSD